MAIEIAPPFCSMVANWLAAVSSDNVLEICVVKSELSMDDLSMDDLTEDRGKAELFIAIDEGRSAEVGGMTGTASFAVRVAPPCSPSVAVWSVGVLDAKTHGTVALVVVMIERTLGDGAVSSAAIV